MTAWNKIYPKVLISGCNGFTFVTLPCISWPKEEADAFIKLLVPAEKHDNAFIMKRANVNPLSALRMYLCKTMSSTFCIAAGLRNQRAVFYIGCRRPPDIFKLLLKMPNTMKTTTWPSDLSFSVRVAENDDYDPEKFIKTYHKGSI